MNKITTSNNYAVSNGQRSYKIVKQFVTLQ
jgi:hypothetical protein